MENELERWSRNFSGSDFFYGLEAGPVARRALRYARPHWKAGATALDLGCGEGQDLVFLAQSGYETTGVDFARTGLEKCRRLLAQHDVEAELIEADLKSWQSPRQFDLALAVNSLQFLGMAAPQALENLKASVAPGGIIGFSAFAREGQEYAADFPAIYRWSLEELLENFSGWQPLEAARLLQWPNPGNSQPPQPFVTLIAQKLL